MSRLSETDLAAARALSREILTLRDDGQAVAGHILPLLREYTGAEIVGIYGTERTHKGEFQITSNNHWHGGGGGADPDALAPIMRSLVSSSPSGWGAFDPSRPGPSVRDRVVSVDMRRDPSGLSAPYRSRIQRFREICRSHKSCVGTYWQTRALVCEGSSLLAWVGFVEHDAPRPQQQRRLAALLPAFKQRLLTERQLRNHSLYESAFVSAIDAIPSPSFIVDLTGRVRHTNAIGLQRLTEDRAGTTAELTQALAGGERARVSPIAAFGLPKLFFVVLRGGTPARAARVELARARWSLTKRQTEVLSLLARGDTNQAIAATLGCTNRTVEAHVTALLCKAQVASRSQLIAEVWDLT